jgi:hypothetical protein
MNIHVEIIPHEDQRYETVGDWFYDDNNNLQIRVSKLSDWRRECLIAVHELVEVLKCQYDGVTQKQVDDFDIAYENARKEGDFSEPGDDPSAPYVQQHCLATGIERILAAELGVNWKEYEDELEALP